MSSWKPGDLRNTKLALKQYDEGEDAREALYAKIIRTRTPGGAERAFNRWNRADVAAVRKVQRAFWNDTSDRNRLEYCFLMSIYDLRMMCKNCPD